MTAMSGKIFCKNCVVIDCLPLYITNNIKYYNNKTYGYDADHA